MADNNGKSPIMVTIEPDRNGKFIVVDEVYEEDEKMEVKSK